MKTQPTTKFALPAQWEELNNNLPLHKKTCICTHTNTLIKSKHLKMLAQYKWYQTCATPCFLSGRNQRAHFTGQRSLHVTRHAGKKKAAIALLADSCNKRKKVGGKRNANNLQRSLLGHATRQFVEALQKYLKMLGSKSTADMLHAKTGVRNMYFLRPCSQDCSMQSALHVVHTRGLRYYGGIQVKNTAANALQRRSSSLWRQPTVMMSQLVPFH